MRRPSHYVLPFFLLLLAVFVATGQLPVEPAPAPAVRAAPGPIAIKAQPPSRAPQATRLKGRLLDPRGYVIAGAEVALDHDLTARTDGDGLFEFEVRRPAPWALQVAAQGFRGQQLRVFGAPADPLWLLLEPAAPWDTPTPAGLPPVPERQGEGFVRTAAGAPLAGALVVVAGAGIRVRTDDIGRYRIPLPEAAELIACYDGGAAGESLCARSEPLRFAGGSGVQPLPDLVLERGAVLRGSLRDPAGRPLVGAPLQLRGQGLERTVESGPDGVFRFGGLLAGSYEVLALAWRGACAAWREVEVDAAVVDCELQLVAPAEKRLRVIDVAGKPLQQGYVAARGGGLRREVASIDADGWVQLSTPLEGADLEVRSTDLVALELRPPLAGDRLVVAMP